jgi:flagellar motor switch protein FliN/FliY
MTMSDDEEMIGTPEQEGKEESSAATESPSQTANNEMGMNLEDMNNMVEEDDGEDDFAPGEPMAKDVEAIYDIPVQISAVLGRSTMQVSQLLKLGRGAVVELDRKVGEAIDIYVNNRLVARGEVVVVDDKLGVTMTEIVKTDRA